MGVPMRVGIAEDDPATRDVLRRMLEGLGHKVVFAVVTGRQLVSECLAAPPDLVLTDIRMPDLDGLDAIDLVGRSIAMPVIVVSGHCDRALIDRAEHNQILAYLVKPITQPQLEAAIALAVRRFEECQSLKRETAELRQALSDRKLLERAKGLLMKHLGVDESTAVARLEKLAASKNKSLTETAQTILNAVELLNSNSKPADGRAARQADGRGGRHDGRAGNGSARLGGNGRRSASAPRIRTNLSSPPPD